jgi:trehalose 6-phosphate phosphatase
MNGTHPVKRMGAMVVDAEATTARAPSIARTAKTKTPAAAPGHLFDAWDEVGTRVTDATVCALLLDFDGTLVKIRRRPWEVRVPQETKRRLDRLARNPRLFVAVVSGRRRQDLQTRIGVPALRLVGLHGAETDGRNTKLSRESKKILALAQRAAIEQIASMPGMRIEDKGLSFAVHYRGAAPQVANTARSYLLEMVEPLRQWLKVFEGAMVWEVLPNEIPGKGAATLDLLRELPPGTPAIYIGDDGTDESAFRALNDQTTIRVGFSPESQAKYYVRSPDEVLTFLSRLETQLKQA